MRFTHVQQSDLNLLTALQALIEERSVSRAAQRACLTQPAMSRKLDRLQEMFQDELLIRTKRGYEPTHRAVHLYHEFESILRRVEEILSPNGFDPTKVTDAFTIAATDYAAIVILPTVVGQITQVAPHINLEVVPWDETVFRRLEANTLDLVLWGNVAPSNLRAQSLFREKLVCLVRRGHPLTNKRPTLKSYASYPHAAVTLTVKTQDFIDRVLREHGLQRKMQFVVPYFAAAAAIVEHSNLVFTIPWRLAKKLSMNSRTRLLQPPSEITKRLASFDYSIVWDRRMDSDPAHQWLRRMFVEYSIAEPS